MHLTPAQYVIRVFKGVRSTARILGRSPSSVSKWTKPKSSRGTEGKVPGPAQHIIIKKAQELKLDITANDLLFGRDIVPAESA